MSYILEALKKSDQERQRQSVPGLNTVHDNGGQPPGKRSRWPWLLLLALFANGAAAAGLLLYLHKAEKPAAAPETPVAGQAESQIPAPSAATAGTPPAGTQAAAAPALNQAIANNMTRQAQPLITPAPPPAGQLRAAVPAAGPAAGPTRPVPQAAPALAQASQPEAVEEAVDPNADQSEELEADSPASEEGAATEAVAEDSRRSAADSARAPDSAAAPPAREAQGVQGPASLPYFDNLPASVKEGMPAIAISFHVYAQKQESRLVSINGKLLREGQEVAEDLRLEQITSEGVVLNYRGERFRMKVF